MAALIDNSTKKTSKDNTSTLTTSAFTIGGSNRVLYVLAYSGAGSPTAATSVKWGGSGGTALTQVSITLNVGSSAAGRATLWRLINPTAQSSTVYADWGTAQDERMIIAVSVKDTDQTTPNNTIANGNSATLTPSLSCTAVTGDLVLNFMALMDDNPDVKALAPGATTLQEIEGLEGGDLDGYECAGAQYTTAASTSQAMSWTVSGTGTPHTNWVAHYSLAINAASGAAATSFPPYRRNPMHTLINF